MPTDASRPPHGAGTNEYRTRPRHVEAMQFDGTAAGVERMVVWMRGVAPGVPVRPRTEYAGWADPTGYLELEVMGLDRGAMAGDWLVVTGGAEAATACIVDEQDFEERFEAVG